MADVRIITASLTGVAGLLALLTISSSFSLASAETACPVEIEAGATPVVILEPNAGTLSADVAGTSLDCVLGELARQSGITIVVKGRAANPAVWGAFEDWPLTEGLRELLQGASYVLTHPDDGGDLDPSLAGQQVTAIRILRSGGAAARGDGAERQGVGAPQSAGQTAAATGHDSAGTAPDDEDGKEDPDVVMERLKAQAEENVAALYQVLAQAIADEDWLDEGLREHLQAGMAEGKELGVMTSLAALVSREGPLDRRLQALSLISSVSQEVSLQSFNDAKDHPDPEVSILAVDLLRYQREALQADQLVEAAGVAIEDGDRQVRAAALEALENMEEFAPVGRVALAAVNDVDPHIRMSALSLLLYGDPFVARDHYLEALSDPDNSVAQQAQDLLRELDSQDLTEAARQEAAQQ